VSFPLQLADVDLAPLWKALAPWWKQFQVLFREHLFLTPLCGMLIVMMTLSFYRFLRSINPALVGFVMLLMLGILILHWTVTRTEPAFLKPCIDWLAPFFPTGDFAPLPKPKR